MKTYRKGTGWEGMGWINLFQDRDIADTEACESFFVFCLFVHITPGECRLDFHTH